MKTRLLTTGCVMLLLITGLACSEDGRDGANGMDGKEGAAGQAGNANVIASEWIFTPPQSLVTIDNTPGFAAILPAPELSGEALNSAAVLVYLRFSGIVAPLPYTSRAGNTANTIAFFPELQQIKLFRFRHDNVAGPVSISSFIEFRYVIIPQGLANRNGSNVSYQDMTYEEVCAALHLQP